MVTLADNSTIWPITNSTSADNVTLTTPSYNTTDNSNSTIWPITNSTSADNVTLTTPSYNTTDNSK
jgi:predicted double-glycine peptidase